MLFPVEWLEAMNSVTGLTVVSVLVLAVVQVLKNGAEKWGIHPLVLLGILSFGLAGGYVVLVQTGHWETVAMYGAAIAAVANTIYTVLNTALELFSKKFMAQPLSLSRASQK